MQTNNKQAECTIYRWLTESVYQSFDGMDSTYQFGTNVGERSWADSYALVFGKRHVSLIVDNNTNTGSFSQIADVLILIRVEQQ